MLFYSFSSLEAQKSMLLKDPRWIGFWSVLFIVCFSAFFPPISPALWQELLGWLEHGGHTVSHQWGTWDKPSWLHPGHMHVLWAVCMDTGGALGVWRDEGLTQWVDVNQNLVSLSLWRKRLKVLLSPPKSISFVPWESSAAWCFIRL